MPQIHISRHHGLPLAKARAIALDWMRSGARDFGIQTSQTLAEDSSPVFQFKRSGLHGSLRVTQENFLLELHLGFLLGTFKERIEAELVRNLELRLAEARASASGDGQTAVNI